MAVNAKIVDLKKLHESRKTPEELTRENKELREKLQYTEAQLTDAQLALCDVYELVLGGATNG